MLTGTNPAQATTTKSDVSVNIAPTLALSKTNCNSSSDPSNDRLDINISSNSAGNNYGANCQTIQIDTNAPGYTLLAKASGSSPDYNSGSITNSLLYQNPTSLTPLPNIPSTTNPASSPSILSPNTWGFAVPANNTLTNFDSASVYQSNISSPSTISASKYASLPTTDITITSQNQMPSTADQKNTTFYYSAGINMQQAAGTYATTITYTAIGTEPAMIEDSASGFIATTSNAEVNSSPYQVTVNGNYHQDATPSPSSPQAISVIENSVDVVTTGKNLFDSYNAVKSANSSNQHVAADGQIRSTVDSDNIAWSYSNSQLKLSLPASDYMLTVISDNKTQNISRGVVVAQSDNSRIISAAGSYGFPDSGDSIISFPVILADTTDIGFQHKLYIGDFYIQLESGAIASSYEPYVSTTTTSINLGNEFMAALPSGVKDELIIGKYGDVRLQKRIKKLVLDGSENWAASTRANSYYLYVDYFNEIGRTEAHGFSGRHAVSDHFEFNDSGMSSSWSSGELTFQTNTATTNENLYLEMSGIVSSLADLKAWLAVNPVTVYYETDSPYTVNLPSISPIVLPSSTSNIWAKTSPSTSVNVRYRLSN